MKIELVGDVLRRPKLFMSQNRVSWALWVDEHIEIASGGCSTTRQAENAAARAWKGFQREVARKRKPIKFQEFA